MIDEIDAQRLSRSASSEASSYWNLGFQASFRTQFPPTPSPAESVMMLWNHLAVALLNGRGASTQISLPAWIARNLPSWRPNHLASWLSGCPSAAVMSTYGYQVPLAAN